MRCLLTALSALLAALVLLSGCGTSSAQQAPRVRVPRTTGVEPLPSGPAILDTIRPYHSNRASRASLWQTVTASISGDRMVQWRMPIEWIADNEGSAHTADDLVDLEVIQTGVAQDGLSMADYLTELAQGEPITSYVNRARYTVYVTSREVSVAPTDPNAPRSMFHTAVIDTGDKFIKVEITFDSALDWRFDDLAHDILGTIQIVPELPATPTPPTPVV